MLAWINNQSLQLSEIRAILSHFLGKWNTTFHLFQKFVSLESSPEDLRITSQQAKSSSNVVFVQDSLTTSLPSLRDARISAVYQIKGHWETPICPPNLRIVAALSKILPLFTAINTRNSSSPKFFFNHNSQIQRTCKLNPERIVRLCILAPK